MLFVIAAAITAEAKQATGDLCSSTTFNQGRFTIFFFII